MQQYINKGAAANDKTGTKARQAADIINDNFTEVYAAIDFINRIDRVEKSMGFSEIVAQDITIYAGWEWIINNVELTNPADVVINDIPFCSAGKTRIDYIVPNELNGFTLVSGEESMAGPLAPSLPNNGIYVTYFTVGDASISTPTTPIIGDNFVSKTERANVLLTGSGIIDELNVLDEKATIVFAGSITEIKTITYAVASYNGKRITLFNLQSTPVTIKNAVGVGVHFNFPNNQDYVLIPNQTIEFSLDFTSFPYAHHRFIGEIRNQISDIENLQTELSDRYTKSEADTLLGLKLDASSYNEHFKGKYTSSGALITAHPTATDGDYAIVDAGTGVDAKEWIWDAEAGWIVSASTGAATTDALAEGSANLYFTTARVLATLLTGISFATGGAIVSTDSVLVAFGKLQKQLNDGFTTDNIKSLLGITTLSGSNTGDQDLSGYLTTSTASTTYEPKKGSDDNYVTDAEKAALGKDTISLAMSDGTTALATGDTDPMHAPYNFTLVSYWVGVKTAPTVSSLIVDVKKNGTSITSTKAGIDATEKTSLTGTSPVLTTTSFTKGDEITPNIYQIGSGETGRSLKLYLEIIKT